MSVHENFVRIVALAVQINRQTYQSCYKPFSPSITVYKTLARAAQNTDGHGKRGECSEHSPQDAAQGEIIEQNSPVAGIESAQSAIESVALE
jgi:hypothetical protein